METVSPALLSIAVAQLSVVVVAGASRPDAVRVLCCSSRMSSCPKSIAVLPVFVIVMYSCSPVGGQG